MPTKPITAELDHWLEYKGGPEYKVLAEFIDKLKSDQFLVDEITDGKLYPKNHVLVLGEHPKGYRADIYIETRSTDETIMLHKNFNVEKILAQQAMWIEYHEEVRTQKQKFESSI